MMQQLRFQPIRERVDNRQLILKTILENVQASYQSESWGLSPYSSNDRLHSPDIWSVQTTRTAADTFTFEWTPVIFASDVDIGYYVELILSDGSTREYFTRNHFISPPELRPNEEITVRIYTLADSDTYRHGYGTYIVSHIVCHIRNMSYDIAYDMLHIHNKFYISGISPRKGKNSIWDSGFRGYELL